MWYVCVHKCRQSIHEHEINLSKHQKNPFSSSRIWLLHLLPLLGDFAINEIIRFIALQTLSPSGDVRVALGRLSHYSSH